ncbi:hypothetical protein ACHHYP_16680 [Achlya hypogyna]|uniref:Uncharacterized protein n=1 Tax=Achlya hypogyna TaxID=1202772 RepID=A0A1V9Y624_ACHHY|nr:hypothetical protein ACHHYP_16680 [Achlya hypogyna]
MSASSESTPGPPPRVPRSSSVDMTYSCPSLSARTTPPEAKRSRSRTSSFSCEAGEVTVSRLPAAPQLPTVPYPVDPYHFTCLAGVDTKDAVAQILRTLNVHDVDLVFQVHKCKFKCVKYVQYDRVDFNVRLYVTANATLLVECQRRSGSLLAWDTLYRAMYGDLARIVDVGAPSCPQSGGQKKVFAGPALLDGVRGPGAPSSSGMDVFVIMLTSHFVDIRAEGCAAVAVATETLLTAHKAAVSGLIALLVAQVLEMSGYEHAPAQLLVSHAPIVPLCVRRDIVRCAVSALANIAAAYPTCVGASAAILAQFKGVLPALLGWLTTETNGGDYTLRELQRECCRAVVPLMALLPAEFSPEDKAALIAFAGRARDNPKMTVHCSRILENLGHLKR